MQGGDRGRRGYLASPRQQKQEGENKTQEISKKAAKSNREKAENHYLVNANRRTTIWIQKTIRQ
jgi:prophage maintenance system killer protein